MAEGKAVTVRKIGVLCNPHYPETLDLAARIREALQERGIQVFCSGQIDQEQLFFPRDLDTLVTLGGDGTMLRAAHLVSNVATPILGIHMGRLGFLAEVRVEDWRESLDRVLANDYWVEERAMLHGALKRDGAELGSWEALNDVVIGRSGMSHMVRLATYVDGGYLTTYVADGLIIATATGSTAYALSAGGPILPPNLRNMLLVPICPHLSLDRTIVLADGATVRVQVESTSDGVLSVDGMTNIALQDQDQIVMTTSSHVARFLRLYDRRQVYETLLERLKPRKITRPYGSS